MDDATDGKEEGTPPEPLGQAPSEGAPLLCRALTSDADEAPLSEIANALPQGGQAGDVTVTFAHDGPLGIRWRHAAARFIVVDEIRPASIAAASAQVRPRVPIHGWPSLRSLAHAHH